MPATLPYELEIDGATLLEAEPFNWPRNNWEPLDVVVSRETGWARLTHVEAAALRALYNGAHGRVDDGPTGAIVQFTTGTGHGAFTITDFRGNSGAFVFSPDDGLALEELVTVSGITYFAARMKFIKVG